MLKMFLPSIRQVSLFFLASFSLLFLQYTFPSTGGAGLQVPVNMSIWLCLSFFCISVFFYMCKSKTLVISRLFLLLFFSCCLLFIPLYYTETRFIEENTLRFVGIWAGLLFYFCLLQLKLKYEDFYIIAWSAATGIFIQAIWGGVQYYFLVNTLGFDSVTNKPYGTSDQVNIYATILVLGIALSLFLSGLKHKYRFLKWVLLLFVFTCAVPLIPTQSRIGLLNIIVVSALCFTWLYFRPISRKHLLALALLLFSGLTLHKVITPNMTKGHLVDASAPDYSATNIIRSTRVGTRTTIFPVAFELFMQEPLKGHGVGMFRPKYLEEQGKYIAAQDSGEPVPAEFYLSHPHNEILFWAIEFGGIGLLFLFIPAIAVLLLLFKQRGGYKLIHLAVLMPLVIHSMTEYPFYLSAFLWLFFVFTLFSLDSSKKHFFKIGWLTITPLLLGGVVAFLYSLIYLDLNYVASQNYAKFSLTGKSDGKYLADIPRVEAFEERFQHELIHLELRRLLDKDAMNAEFTRKYIYWSYSVAQSHPTPDLYYNLIEGLVLFKEYVKAREISAKARNLFPYAANIEEQYFRMYPELVHEKPE